MLLKHAMYPINLHDPSSSSTSSVDQHLNGTSGNPAAGNGRAQPGPFTLSTWSQTNPDHEPPVALVLADWSAIFTQVHADLSGLPPPQQRNRMSTSLWNMSQDMRLPSDLRKHISEQATRMRTNLGYGAHDFQQFQRWVQDESAARSGNPRVAQGTSHRASHPASTAPTTWTMQSGQAADLNLGPVPQAAHSASAVHGVGGGQVPMQVGRSQTISTRMPPDAQALADWASTFEQIQAYPTEPSTERSNRIADSLVEMAKDPNISTEIQNAAINELAGLYMPDQTGSINNFVRQLRSASQGRVGDVQGAVRQMSNEGTRPIHDDPAQRNLPMQDVHGTAAMANAASTSQMVRGHDTGMVQGPTATAGNGHQFAFPTPINNAHPDFQLPPGQRNPLNPNISPVVRNMMNEILADPTRSTITRAQDLVNQGLYRSVESAKVTLTRARQNIAFGASDEARENALQMLRSCNSLTYDKAFRNMGRWLLKSNANTNPLLPQVLASAADNYVRNGGRQDNMTWSDLTPHVADEHKRIYEVFLNKDEGYATPGRHSPGPISVDDSRGITTANLQAQVQQPQPSGLANHLPQFPPMPMSGNAGVSAGGEAASSSGTGNKRPRTNGEFETASNVLPPMSQSMHLPQQPIAWSTQDQPAPIVMPFGQQVPVPGQAAQNRSDQPLAVAGSGSAIPAQSIQPPPLTPVLNNPTPLQVQPQQPLQMQPVQPLQALERLAQTQPLLASQQPLPLQTAQQSLQTQSFQVPQQFQPVQHLQQPQQPQTQQQPL